jgi:hypothetical protein
MRTYLTPTEDTTLYERWPTQNTGLDEILEVGKLTSSIQLDSYTRYESASVRSLLNFDISAATTYPSSSRYFLNLYIANAERVPRNQTIEVFPVSGTWTEGSGYRYQTKRFALDGASWASASSTAPWTTVGGDYLTSVSASTQVTITPINDIRIDVTDIIQSAINDDFAWNGLLLKYPTTDELDTYNEGNIKVFSSNTHTVFSPKLEVVWNSQVFTTGSLKPIPSSKIHISARNIKQAYTRGEVDTIRFVVRDQYPDKRFDATPRYRNQYYLPSSSYYRIVDEVSGVKIHDFDQYSAISCDASGSYITLDTTGLDVGRYYRLELKVTTNNLVFFPETVYSFMVDTDE